MVSLVERTRQRLIEAGRQFVEGETFPIELADRRQVQFRPTFTLAARSTDEPTVVVHVLDVNAPWGALRRLGAFRRRYGQTHTVALVVPESLVAAMPNESYDRLTPESRLDDLVATIGVGHKTN